MTTWPGCAKSWTYTPCSMTATKIYPSADPGNRSGSSGASPRQRHRVCGALTTYSTFSYETVRLIQDGFRRLALLNVVGSVATGLAGGMLGFVLARTLFG
ncbi:fluoride efflux transporter FluC [Catellatospora aurea]|uniref:Fluoride-specific ion channel n=1 Tax=Catellatospora aurea TaxID=1337874 RepID=A0ABW2H5A7_9ACTN